MYDYTSKTGMKIMESIGDNKIEMRCRVIEELDVAGKVNTPQHYQVGVVLGGCGQVLGVVCGCPYTWFQKLAIVAHAWLA